MSIFDPHHLPGTEEELSEYGTEQIKTLTDLYSVEQRINVGGNEGISQADIEAKETESEWKLFQRLIFLQYKGRSLQFVLPRLLGNGEIYAAFPNLAKIAAILGVLPVTTTTVERSFSNMKLLKTRLRSRMSEETLDYYIRICIEGPDQLSDENLEAVLEYYKGMKIRKIKLCAFSCFTNNRNLHY